MPSGFYLWCSRVLGHLCLQGKGRQIINCGVYPYNHISSEQMRLGGDEKKSDMGIGRN